jgi:hypothetical protein
MERGLELGEMVCELQRRQLHAGGGGWVGSGISLFSEMAGDRGKDFAKAPLGYSCPFRRVRHIPSSRTVGITE